MCRLVAIKTISPKDYFIKTSIKLNKKNHKIIYTVINVHVQKKY